MEQSCADSVEEREFSSLKDVVNHPSFKPKVIAHADMGFSDVGFIRMRFDPGVRLYPALRFPTLSHYKSPSRIGYEFDGREVPVRDYLPGELLLRPQESYSVADYHRRNDVCVLTIGTDSMRAIIDDPQADIEDRLSYISARPFRSQLVSELLKRLETETFDTVQPIRPLYMDTLLQAVCLELWRLSSDTTENRLKKPCDDISKSVMKEIDDFVDQTGEASVNIKSLAKIAKLPVARFCRVFKDVAGKTPYQYVIERRIARARSMVEGTSLSLAEIAFRCGFSSQSHMTDVFRAKIGATPGAFRKALS